MSYLVLARKWRPQNFAEVVGQPHVTRTLQNAIRSQRIAHAYLFTGARGVGKTSVARILAKSINCTGAVEEPPCNVCSNCREITQGNSVDVLEIDGASNRGIDSIRELRETVRYRPAKSRYKIYIIDEVHMLTTEAFNALLKTLEEPPEHVLFVFATTEPHKVLSTILSRCQRFDFRRIATSELVKHLHVVASNEGVEISEDVIYAIAREADGSMRDAQSLLEQLLAFSSDDLVDEEILDVLGVVDRRSVHRVAGAIITGDAKTCLEVVADLYRRGIDSRRFCQQLCDHFRNLFFWTLNTDGNDSLQQDLPSEEVQVLQQEAKNTTPETLYLYFQMILKGEEEIRRSSLPRIALEMLLVRLTKLPQLQSLQNLLGRLGDLEARLACGGNVPVADEVTNSHSREQLASHLEEEPPPPDDSFMQPPNPPLDADAIMATGDRQSGDPVTRWNSFLQWLQTKDPILQAKLSHSQISMISQSSIQLEVPEVYEDALRDRRTLAKLSQLALSFLGTEAEWIIKGRSSLQPVQEGLQKTRSSKQNSKRMVMEHPMVQQALEILGGELIDIKNLQGRQSTQKIGD
jgi:DNA polymerase III subunit gamma/tau